MSDTRRMWYVPDSGMMPVEVDVMDQHPSALPYRPPSKTNEEYVWISERNQFGTVGWSLFFSEQDAIARQIDECNAVINDRQRKLIQLIERRGQLAVSPADV